MYELGRKQVCAGRKDICMDWGGRRYVLVGKIYELERKEACAWRKYV